MVNKVTYKDIWQISWPIMIGSAVENIINLTDTLFLGHLNEVALGAGAVGGIFYLSFIMLGFGFSIGTQILVARRYGEQKPSEIGKIIWHSAIFMLSISIILVFIVQNGSNYFFNFSIKSNEVNEAVKVFINYRIWGLPFAFINMLFRSFYIGIARTKTIGFITFLSALLNVIIGYGLIFGHWGLPALGIRGAAIASVIAELLGGIFFIVYTFYFTKHAQFGLFKKHTLSYSILINNFKVAGPVMIQFFLAFAGWFLFFLFVEKMGEIPLAASNILRTLYSTINLPLWGFASAANTLVSSNMGAGRSNVVFLVLKKCAVLCLSTMVFLLVAIWSFNHQIFALFTTNQIIIDNCINTLPVLTIGGLLLSVAVVLYNGVSGSGNTLVSFMIETTIIITYCILSYLILVSGYVSVPLIWVVEIHYALVMGIMSFLYLRYGKWRLKKI